MTKIISHDQLVNGTIALAMPLIVPPRRRARLNGSCAVAALLALPAAMSVGIMLARPAQAQTDINSNKYATVILGNTTNYPDGNPFTIYGGTTVNAPTGDGVYGNAGTYWTLTNYGVIIGGTANGVGFSSGGSIGNGFSDSSLGTISGATDGVYTAGSLGVILNIGLIQGSANSGVEMLAGGTIINVSEPIYVYPNFDTFTGTISGGTDGVLIANTAADVTNGGTIIGATGDGVNNSAGGYVVNNVGALISGSGAGVNFAGAYGTLANQGAVTGVTGAAFNAGGTVDNYGVINGATYGVSIGGGPAIISNQAQVDGTTQGVISGDTGVLITSNNGFVINTAPAGPFYAQATIAGSSYGVKLTGANGTVVNYGLISANGEGGVAVSATNQAEVYNFGSIIGNSGGVLISGGGDVLNESYISGAIGVGIDGGGTVNSTVVNYGLISGSQNGVSLSGGTGNADFGTFGSVSAVFNDGTIQELGNGTDAAAIVLSGAAVVYNGVTLGGEGSISNPDALIQGVSYGVLGSGGTLGGTIGVANAGTIIGALGSGVLLSGTGLVENIGTILGGTTGVTTEGANSAVLNVYNVTAGIVPVISGGTDGVLMTGTAATMVNIGTVVGYSANEGNPSGTGVSLGNGGAVINSGSGSNFAVISGGSYGIHVTGSDGYIFNDGYVAATNSDGTGAALGNAGYLSNTSFGTIQGGSIGVAVGVHTYGTQLPAGVIANAGSIAGGDFGVSMAGYGMVNNTIGAYIRGNHVGVYIAGVNASLTNVGTITTQPAYVPNFAPGIRPLGEEQSTGVSFANGGYVSNGAGGYIYGGTTGVAITGGVQSEVGNLAGGYIKGGTTGVFLNGGNDQLYNAGSIIGDLHGAVLENGGTVYNSGIIAGTGDQRLTDGVSLSQGGNVTNTSSGVIYGYLTGINAYGAAATIVNDGSILAPGLYLNGAAGYKGIGVYSQAGGTLTNGTLGLISGYGSGVEAYGTMSVTNRGSIAGGTDYGVSLDTGSITNYGAISGAETGAYVNTGSITNLAGGQISGSANGVVMNGAGADSVYNAGTISGFGGYGGTGVYLKAGGAVTNTGEIYGTEYGVYVHANPGTIINSGTIAQGYLTTSTYAAVYLYAGGTVMNMAAGTIISANTGVIVSNAAGTIINAGLIDGIGYDGVSLNHGGSVVNSNVGTILGAHIGVYTGYAGASVANYGIIAGETGDGVSLYQGGSVFNAGTIFGGYAGVYIAGAGSQLRNQGDITGAVAGVLASAGSIINGPTASIIGETTGVAGIINPVDVTNAGTIIGLDGVGVSLAAGGNVTNDEGGTIAGQYTGVLLDTAGTLLNSGLIYSNQSGDGNYAGVALLQGGSVQNNAGGGIYGYTEGVYLGNGAATLMNNGVIGGYRYGVNLRNAGTSAVIINGGTVTAAGGDSDGVFAEDGTVINQQAGAIEGQYAVAMSAGTLLNAGQINGVYAGVTTDGSLVVNYASGTITGGVYGVEIFAASGTMLNSGAITGSNSFGVTLANDGAVNNYAGGVISGASFGLGVNGTAAVTNSGTIFGASDTGLGINYGTVVNTQGGTIIGGNVGVSSYEANVTNAGSIGGGFAGVSAYEIDLTNLATGRITGANGVGIYGSIASVTNAGSIVGSEYTGVNLPNGGTVTNLAGGSIYGHNFGVSASSFASIDNSGTIDGATGAGVYLGTGGVVLNRVGGHITSNGIGLNAEGAAVVTNAGDIRGYYGIQLHQGGAIYNMAGATIAGSGDAVDVENAAGTIINEGTIIATGNDYSGINFTSNSGTIDNTGIISGGEYGVALSGAGVTLTNYAEGRISGGYDGVTASNDTLTNAGSITGGVNGVVMYGGVLNNLAGGKIQGNSVGLYAYDAVVSNAGLIADDVTAGAVLGSNTTLTNQHGGTISGVDGIDFVGANATVFNAGTIASTAQGGTAIAFDDSVNYLTLSTGSVLDGIIDGGGSDSQIALIGTGTLNNTIQNFGTAGALEVSSGASWIGTGNWAIPTVTNNGTFQGGQLNKPLNLTGDFIQASLATLKVVVTPTLSSQFLITGAAQLAGNLTYVFAPGYYSPHTYDFLTASDGTTGDFATVTYSGLVPPQLTHTTNATPPGANLVLAGNGFVTPADDGVFNEQAQAMADSAQQANTSLLGKASQGAGAGSSAAEACAAEAGAAQNTATTNATTASRMATAVASAFCGAGGWIEATGTEMNADSSGGAADYHADTGGFLAGIDKAVNNIGTRIGLAVGYDETWLHDGDSGKANVDTVRVGLYASQPIGRFTVAADVMYGHGSNTTHRATGIGEANANYGTDIYSGAVQGSTEMSLGPIDLVPAAGLRIAHISSGSFAETGGGFVPAFAVTGSGTSYTSVQPFVNMGFGHSFLTASGMNITPSAGLGFIYEAGDRGKSVDVTAGDFTNFAATHNNLDRATAVLSAGIAAGRNNWSLFAHYTAYVSGNWTSQTAEAGLQVKF